MVFWGIPDFTTPYRRWLEGEVKSEAPVFCGELVNFIALTHQLNFLAPKGQRWMPYL